MAKAFFIDPQRCIGCFACVMACRECDSHKGVAMIHLDAIASPGSRQVALTVCMHCLDAPCVQSCPQEAIKVTEDGIVLSANKESCDSTRYCLYACPFAVPMHETRPASQDGAPPTIMMKCDQCYDRRTMGLAPWCATVCPTGALAFGEYDEVVAQRRGRAVNEWQFGNQRIRTRVYTFVPRDQEVISIQGEPRYLRYLEKVAYPKPKRGG